MGRARQQEVSFEAPPWMENAEGKPRRVGLELEMAGINAETLAAAVVDELGGEVKRDSAFLSRVVNTELGDFSIELDARLLKERTYQKQLAELGIDIGEGDWRDQIELMISRVAGLVVPLELVGPPLPWTELDRMDAIRKRLHEAGARGTGSSPIYAFGMQINIEAAGFDAEYLLAMLRAFLLSFEWLKERENVDLSRRITPFVQPYPSAYVKRIMADDYRPDFNTLVDDFLKLTPTRNRPLDMLPLFAHIDEERVLSAPVEKELVKPRPAFHYRLPNCRIDDPDWSLHQSWNDWVEIERLAANGNALENRRREFLTPAGPIGRWIDALRQRLSS